MTMNDYLIREMAFSYSSVSSFDTCAWGWYLTYIESSERENNFFSQYGTLIHKILEGYWTRKYTLSQLTKAYKDLYSSSVTLSPPPYPKGMSEKYYDDGIAFFKSFDIKRKSFKPLFIEGNIVDEYNGIKVIVRPDILLKRKYNDDIYLLDYKTSKPVKSGEWDLNKIKSYEYQLLLYAYFIEKNLKIKIDKIGIMFVRVGNTYFVENSNEKTQKVLEWFSETVDKIKSEKDFSPNTSNKYFCDNLCGVRKICEYRK